MKAVLRFNFHFLQFVLLIVFNFALNGIVLITGRMFGFESVSNGGLGAPDYFIIYNNVLKAFLAVVIIHFYQNSPFHTISKPFLRYLLLAFFIIVANSLAVIIIEMLQNNPLTAEDLTGNLATLPFKITMVGSTLLVYFLASREETKQVKELNHLLQITTLQELKAKAELNALQAKVNPHFLYNSLNNIYNLIDIHQEKAKEMVVLLSKLFRLSVNTSDNLYCTVRQEVDLVKTYLSIEKVRFGEKLNYKIIVSEELLDHQIPRFLLQPLVENSILHGTSKLPVIGSIQVVITKDKDMLKLEVVDNGLPFAETLQFGYGLKGVLEKVKRLGRPGSFLEIVSEPSEQLKRIIIRLT